MMSKIKGIKLFNYGDELLKRLAFQIQEQNQQK